MFSACQQQRLDKPFTRDHFPLGVLKVGGEKRMVESRMMRRKASFAEKCMIIVDDMEKPIVSFRDFGREPLVRECLGRHVMLVINVRVKRCACWEPVEQLDATEFDAA